MKETEETKRIGRGVTEKKALRVSMEVPGTAADVKLLGSLRRAIEQEIRGQRKGGF